MPRISPFQIVLSKQEREALEHRARKYTLPYFEVLRAKMILLAAQGRSNDEIGASLDIGRDVVSLWRKRFFHERLPGLEERPRPGHPRFFPPEVVVQVKAIACELPATLGVPLSRLSSADIVREAQRSGIVATLSDRTVWRWLHEDAIRPWQHRTWIFPRDPQFISKAGRILDLYARHWEDRPLRDDEFVLSADEKTSIQARIRKHASLPPRPGQPARVEHEYARGGAWAYLAAMDVHRAKFFGRCEQSTGIEPFNLLVTHVMTQPPYRDARRVFWIMDNGSASPVFGASKQPSPISYPCTDRSTRAGSIKSKSTSPSLNARRSHPTTSTRLRMSKTDSSASNNTMRTLLRHSSGNSRVTTLRQ